MASNAYHFTTHWRMQSTERGDIQEYEQRRRPEERWWPSVYLDVQVLEPGDKQGMGRVVSLYTKGWLPIRPYVGNSAWPMCPIRPVLRSRRSKTFTGRGVWRFEQDGDWVNITYDWSITANKPLLRRFSLLFKPVSTANHHWAMAKGEERRAAYR